jgi:hypothetical protein
LAASACDIHQNIQSATSASTSNASNVSLPYTTGINPHVYSFANSISQSVYSNLPLATSVPSVASNLNLNSSHTPNFNQAFSALTSMPNTPNIRLPQTGLSNDMYPQNHLGVSGVYTQAFVNSNNPFSAPVTSYKPLNRPLYTRVSSKLREKMLSN